jgi:hypothetical protein
MICSIHLIVGKVCVKVWASKIFSEFQNYIKAGEAGVNKKSKTLQDAIEGTIIKLMSSFVNLN